jgi:tetratricopeptide (TPR) repeat protein
VDDILPTIDRLLQLDDAWSVIDIGRAFFKRKEYDKSLKVFEHIKSKIQPSNQSYYRLLANLAYSQIGLNRNADAIDNLLQIKELNRGRDFGPWHALALAYAYLKSGNVSQCQRWIEHVQKDGAVDLDLGFFEDLCPEMADRIRSLAEE